jgi:hypothetical protein
LADVICLIAADRSSGNEIRLIQLLCISGQPWAVSRLSPHYLEQRRGWEHINLTGDYVWQ